MSKGRLVRTADFTDCRIPLRQPASPRPGEVHAWYLDLGMLGRSLQSAFDGPGEMPKATSLTLGQLRFTRYFYLRLLLGAYLGLPGKSIKICRSERGKPVLDRSVHGSDLHFSFAKSEDRLLIGISTTGLVGVDLEPASRRAHNPLAVARRYFSDAEARALEGMPQERISEAFLRAWACKEAVVKASGEGIANQLCRFSVEMDPDRTPAILDFEGDDVKQWSLAVVQPEAEFLGAIASHHGQMSIQAYRLLPSVDRS